MKSRLLGMSALAILLALSMTGCAKNGIVGKWSGTVSGNGISANALMDFKPDGSDTITLTSGSRTSILNETYTINGNTLNENVSSRIVNGQTSSRPAKPKTCTFKIEGDKLTLMPPGSTDPIILTRVNQ